MHTVNSGENHEPSAGRAGSTEGGTGVPCEGEKPGGFWERALLWPEEEGWILVVCTSIG